jgi:hypothetical protein
MVGADYLNDVIECADDLFYQLGEDEEIFNEVGFLLRKMDKIVDGIHETWCLDWIDATEDADQDVNTLIASIFALDEILGEVENIPDELHVVVRELLNILEPLNEPPLVMDDQGEMHEDGFED